MGDVGIDPRAFVSLALDYGYEIFAGDFQHCGRRGRASLGFTQAAFDEYFIAKRFIGVQAAEKDISSGFIVADQMNGSGEHDVKRVSRLAFAVQALSVSKALQSHAFGEGLEIIGCGENPEEFDPTKRLDDVFPR